ncbi:related to protein disulfide isomerase-Laccaria bicolor [Serendipita indica DSM 11827]|uniref:Related to protein disulfide isomerase-Laccaria bicolor n=1 Tax=Serendipita indica (strain DSM 11827) TaxID=1109443 RepID=G4TWW5_SERID|nr:related to protein disulfide isomerase-Laccaria bicolor [Serendipita indica DSM 11827]
MWTTLRPASIFLSSLLLLVASTPLPVQSKETPELRQLTGQNFEESIKTNHWFVEFFSPYCPHCTAFKPDWTKIVAARDDPPRLNLAQVDCVANGDLCRAQNVPYYPYLRLYRNEVNGTQTQDVFGGSRTIENIEKWLDERSPKPKSNSIPQHNDQVSIQQKKYNVDGKVLVLGANTFREQVAKEPTFVKFFAPWCGHCQKLAPKWVELAEKLKGVINVAEVNCDAHGTLCRDQEIEGYPTVTLYLNGKKVDYTGSKSVPAMEDFARKVMSPRVEAVDEEQFEKKLKEQEVIFLLLHSGKDERLVSVVASAAQPLLGNPPILTSTSKALYAQYNLQSASSSSVPVLLAIKSHSQKKYAAKIELDGLVTGSGNAERLETWLQRHRFPVVSKLGMDNFYSVMKNPTKPFVVLAAIDSGHDVEAGGDEEAVLPNAHPEQQLSSAAQDHIQRLSKISEKWAVESEKKERTREVVFVWMDGRRWGRWLKNMYGIKDVTMSGGVGLVVVDHGSLLYYDSDDHGKPLVLSEESVWSTLRAIYDGKAKPRHSENLFERIARSVNNRLMGLETFVRENVKTTVFLGVMFFAFCSCHSDGASTLTCQTTIMMAKSARTDGWTSLLCTVLDFVYHCRCEW